ncbi:HPP family protein [Kitasatospora sp. NPDC048365]|uniref:CBS domain-containing protein n=1 Tax=Kitasatospora sp. NPDC048365 TaxID=3364050 RepID=UPI0037173B43
MNRHSILDGTPRDDLTGSGQSAAAPPVSAFMRRPAVAVTLDTDFATLVAAVTASRYGVLPVVGRDGTVVGVVAASDLLTAYAAAAGPDRPPALVRARDLMTAPAVTVTEDRPARDALRTALRAAVHHLPVVDADGRPVGLLSPYDLLDALRRADQAIRDEALALALTPGSGVVPGSLHVRCERGTVLLAGRTRTRSDAAALCLAVSRIDGLAGLTDHLLWDLDDVAPAGGPS